jgi:hypothetical protein
MDHNNEGRLDPGEREELEALAELSEELSSCGPRPSRFSLTMAIDPETGVSVSLFHPVRQAWSDPFRFSGHRIEGSTPIGRAAVAALDLNHLRRQRIRAVEQRFGLYPPIR